MISIIAIALLAGVRAEIVDHAIKFTGAEFVEDTTHKGEYVYNVIEHEPHAHHTRRPSRIWYPKLYESFPIRFVTGLPQLIGISKKHTRIDLYTLSASISKSAAAALHQSEIVRRLASKHTGFGILLKDDKGNEMGRISAAFWAVSNADHNVPKLNADNTSVTFLNRAITSYTISKGSWENGYWESAKQLNAHPLGFDSGYNKFEHLLTQFAQKYPFFASHELRHVKTDEVLQPSVSCPTFLEHMVKGFTGRDALQENLAPVGTPVWKVPDGQHLPVGQQLAAQVAKGNHEALGYSKFTVLHPFFYDKHYQLQSLHETPSHVHAFTPAGMYWRHNFNAGELLPKSFNGFLAAMKNNTAKAIEQQKEQTVMWAARQLLGKIMDVNPKPKEM